jgi:uncharacterized protein Yka (UPF0111/DUF47 family)
MERLIDKQAQEMTRVAREMTEAARELRHAVDRLAELHQHPKRALALTQLLGSGGLSEEEADQLAREAVHDVPAEISRERENNPEPTNNSTSKSSKAGPRRGKAACPR